MPASCWIIFNSSHALGRWTDGHRFKRELGNAFLQPEAAWMQSRCLVSPKVSG